MNKPCVWIVDDDASIRWVIEKSLSKTGFDTRTFASAEDCMMEAGNSPSPDLLVTDIRMPGKDGIALLRKLKQQFAGLPVIVISAQSDLDNTLAAFESGALEMLSKPFDVTELASLATRLLQEQERPVTQQGHSPVAVIGNAPGMQNLFRIIGRLSRASMPVLITGESGSGKELIAHTLHQRSPRASQPFVAINTAAIPAELLESELFGHERGAFTGAHQRRAGRFEQAEGGTLFLDEIGDMPIEMQTRLLRVLSEKEYFRVGGHQAIRSDVRIIAATHQDLELAVKQGRFREDLYHRLNVIPLSVPPLRRRSEDIPALVAQFLQDAAEEMATEPRKPDRALLDWMKRQSWPGNVRELKNFCRRLTALVPTPTVTLADVDAWMNPQERSTEGVTENIEALFANHRGAVAAQAVASLEIALIREALARCHQHKQKAAELLGWGRNTLTRKMKEYRLETE